jgi:hypothetical protein
MEYNIKFEGTLKVDENSVKPEVSGLSVKPFNMQLNDTMSPSELISELMKGKELPKEIKNLDLNKVLGEVFNMLTKQEDKKNE